MDEASLGGEVTTVLFLLLHAIKGLASPWDTYWFCVYVGLDLIALPVWWRWWRDRRQ